MDAVPLRPEDTQEHSEAARGPQGESAVEADPQQRIRLVRNEHATSSDRDRRWDGLNAEGTQHFLAGRFRPAQTDFESALDVAREFSPDDPRLATSLNNLGETYRIVGHFDYARPLLEEALTQRLRVLGAQHPHVARSRNNLGFLCESIGQYFQALDHYRDAYLAMSRLPAVYPVELSSTLLHLARLAAACGAHEHAEQLLDKASDIIANCMKPQDAEAGLQLYISGQVQEMGERFRESWYSYRSSLRLLAGALGPDHYLLAPVLAGTARTLRARGHQLVAERVLRRALTILEAAFDPPHHEIANVLNSLAELYRSSGRDSLSELLYRRVLGMVEATVGESHPDAAAVLYNLALLHEQRGEAAMAGELMSQVEEIDRTIQLPPIEAFDNLNTATIGR